jgi:hypothetical protein
VLHSFQLQGERGWYRTGTKKEVEQGEFVEFVVGNNSAAKDIKKSAPPAQQAAPARNSAASSSGGGRDGYWEAKEARDLEKEARYQNVDVPRMVYQASQERAIALLKIALETEALSLPAKKADKLPALLAYTHQIAQQLMASAFDAHEHLADIRAAVEEDDSPSSGHDDGDDE